MIVNGWAIALFVLYALGLIIGLVRVGKGKEKIPSTARRNEYGSWGCNMLVRNTLHVVLLAGALGAYS